MLSFSGIAVEFKSASKAKSWAFPPILPINSAALSALILSSYKENDPK